MSLIDIHCHTLPMAYTRALEIAGVHDCEGFKFPAWNEAAHLGVMDRHDIASSIVSISAPGLNFVSGQAARDIARRINEDAADRRLRTKGRFGAFAVLPMPDVKSSIAEMDYALDVLKLDGVGIFTNFDGIYPGDPKFDEFFAAADQRGAVVYTHPIAPRHYRDLVLGYSASAFEYPFDTSRMLINLCASGTLRRYKKMKLIASHGGGTIPYLSWRIASISPMFNRLDPAITHDEIINLLQNVYYDCCGVSDPAVLPTYSAFVPAGRRLYGSDTPFMPEQHLRPAINAIEAHYGPTDLAQLATGNARELFPALARLLDE